MAKRLIDADELKACVKNRLLNGAIISWLFRIIDTCPTVDAVEVVFCKDCKFWESIHCNYQTDGFCRFLSNYHDARRPMTDSNHYCAYGERKSGIQPQREDVYRPRQLH